MWQNPDVSLRSSFKASYSQVKYIGVYYHPNENTPSNPIELSYCPAVQAKSDKQINK